MLDKICQKIPLSIYCTYGDGIPFCLFIYLKVMCERAQLQLLCTVDHPWVPLSINHSLAIEAPPPLLFAVLLFPLCILT